MHGNPPYKLGIKARNPSFWQNEPKLFFLNNEAGRAISARLKKKPCQG
jgi:hypothetical protein